MSEFSLFIDTNILCRNSVSDFLKMSSGFDDKAGIIQSKTDWGCWYQTIEDVTAEVCTVESVYITSFNLYVVPYSFAAVVRFIFHAHLL